MSITYILILFLHQLAAGMMATVALIPTPLVDRRFFKSIAFWATLFVGLAWGLKNFSTFLLPSLFRPIENSLLIKGSETSLIVFGLLSLFLWGLLRFSEKEVSRARILMTALVGLISVILNSLLYRSVAGPLWIQNVLIPLNFVSASLVLGGFLTGMIFGHWYLVNTDMPKKLLVTMAWILIGVLALRILAVSVSLWLYQLVVYPDEPFLIALTSFRGHGIFFWQRILVGLAVPAGVVALIWNTARIGSNQSATGIMYVAIAFIFIGELAARYLFLISAIPL